MSDNNKQCVSDLLKEIMSKLDPIINEGLDPNKALTDDNVDACISKTIESLEKSVSSIFDSSGQTTKSILNSTTPQELPYSQLAPTLNAYVNEVVLSVVKTYIETQDTQNIKKAGTPNTNPLLMPEFYGDGSQSIYRDYEYAPGINTYDSYISLGLIKRNYLTALAYSLYSRDLSSIKGKSNTYKKEFIKEKVAYYQNCINRIENSYKEVTNKASNFNNSGRTIPWSQVINNKRTLSASVPNTDPFIVSTLPVPGKRALSPFTFNNLQQCIDN